MALLETSRSSPGLTGAVEASFCNESVFGNLNVLSVSGVVRLEPPRAGPADAPPPPPPPGGFKFGHYARTGETFDAWPSKQVRLETEMNIEAPLNGDWSD